MCSQAPVGTERGACLVRTLFGPAVGCEYLTDITVLCDTPGFLEVRKGLALNLFDALE